jgi:hypothetical protein
MPRGASWWSIFLAWWRGRRYEKAMNEAAVRAREKARAHLRDGTKWER